MTITSRLAWILGGGFTILGAGVGLVAWYFYPIPIPALQLFPDWRSAGPVAVSLRWSVILEEKPIHPFLAEYDYRLRIFASEGREGWYHGTVDLITNAGGRTFLCLYLLTMADRPTLLEAEDRMESSIVDLRALRRVDSVPIGYERRFLGAFVEEAQPLRFVPAQIEPACPPGR